MAEEAQRGCKETQQRSKGEKDDTSVRERAGDEKGKREEGKGP